MSIHSISFFLEMIIVQLKLLYYFFVCLFVYLFIALQKEEKFFY